MNMKLEIGENSRGVWLIYFLGNAPTNDPPFRGTLIEAISQATKDGRQFREGHMGVVIVPIVLELEPDPIEAGKVISIAAAISAMPDKVPEPIPDQASREARQAEYSKALKAMAEDGDATARKENLFVCSRCGSRFSSAAKTLIHKLACRVDIAMGAAPSGSKHSTGASHPRA